MGLPFGIGLPWGAGDPRFGMPGNGPLAATEIASSSVQSISMYKFGLVGSGIIGGGWRGRPSETLNKLPLWMCEVRASTSLIVSALFGF